MQKTITFVERGRRFAFGRRAKSEKEKELLTRCYAAGMRNGWASGAYAKADGNFIVEEDRLNPKSIMFIDDAQELKDFFKHGNWCLGQGVIFGNLFFLQQINGGDEWAVYEITDKTVKQFESMTWRLSIERGEFEKDLNLMRKGGLIYWKEEASA